MSLKVLRVYIENSVIGGYFDEEFEVPTRKLFDLFKTGVYKPVISSHVIKELDDGAPDYVKNILTTIDCEIQEMNREMQELAKIYIDHNAVTINYINDALHIAIATVLGVDVLVSWNFRHIVNLDRIKIFNAVNIMQGYKAIEIRSPKEVLKDE